MSRPAAHPRPAAGLIATGLVAATLTAAGLLAAGLLAASAAHAAEPFDGSCEIDTRHGMANPLIVTGFKTASAAVPADQEAQILAFVRTVSPDAAICVVGQADKRGPADLNDRLAMDRARAVAARLIGAGIEPANLSLSSRAEAFGDAAPEWFWFDGSRRVEVIAVR